MGGTPKNTPETFWLRVQKGDGCWPWTGLKTSQGYGRLRYRGSFFKAHRLAYLLTHGHLPDGAFVLHSCDNPSCCNPEHLRLGDHAENMRDRSERGRSHASRTTHCPQGHPYEGENIYWRGNGHRVCRTCHRARRKRYWEQKEGTDS